MATTTTSTSAVSATPGATKVKAKRSKPRKILMVLLVLLLLGGAGTAGGYYFSGHFKTPSADATAAPASAEPIYVALAPMTVNLKPNDAHTFLHVSVTLKVADAKAQTLVNQYLPEVTSRLLLALSNRQSESLATAADKATLAAETLAVLNQPFGTNLPAVKISKVMFPVFMLQ